MSIIRFIGANDLDLNSTFLPEGQSEMEFSFQLNSIYSLCVAQME